MVSGGCLARFVLSVSLCFFFKEIFSYFSFDFDFGFGKGGEVGNGGFQG